MRALIKTILIAVCIPIGSAVAAQELSSAELAGFFASPDMPDADRGYKDFESAVPETSRTAALVKILETSNNSQSGRTIQAQVIYYIQIRKIAWIESPLLSALVMERMRSGIIPRLAVFNLIVATCTGETKKALVLTFLADSEDDLRSRAITEINGFNGGDTILKSYINEHESDKEYKTSVDQAKRWLKYRENQKGK
ncbi:MAG TPA: hypothetical protein VKX17_01595 [Planctomycetota bacterium]|nr:hypothetical protein [Planctomycetota bacterium]